MDAQTSSSLSLNSNNNGQRRSKKDEALYQQTKLNNLRHLVRRKEEELYRLSSQLELEERQISQINRKLADRAAHASPTRSTSCVADADDSSPSALVGSEVEASRARHQRKKALLRETVHKMRAKLDDELASARSLHVEIEKMRQTRLQHRRTVEKQAKRLQKSVGDNAAMVMAAQRAYAERETCLIKLSEIKREHEAQTQQWEDSMDECDKEARALDEECMRRDQELAELENETEEAVAEARAEERERERERSAHEEVRQRRLALDNDMRVLKEKLGSESVEQLCESFKSTAAKILSLWQKHGEQRSELDRVMSEIGALNEEHERLTSATGASLAASPALVATEGLEPLASASQGEQLRTKEQVVASLCKRMQELLESPLLGDSLGGVASKPEDAVRVDQYNLLGLLGLVESAAVRIARERRAQLVALREASQSRGDGRRISLRQSLSTKETVPAPVEADGRERNYVPKITPPSIEGAGVSRRRMTLVQQQQEHGAHPGNDPKMCRKALKGELMAQILGGVQEQMEKIHEEELQARRGERVPDAQTSPPVDRAGRDKQINQWISKRRESALAVGKHQAGRRQTAPATRRFSLASFGSSLPKVSQRRCTSVATLPAAGASSTPSLAESTASRKSVPASASKPSVASKSYDSAANKVVSSVKRASSVYASAGAPRKPRVRGNSVVSQLLRPFGTSSVIAGSGQDVLEWVGRSNADPIFSRALAATCLPRLNASASSPDLGGTSNPAAAGDRVVITNCAPGAAVAAESAEAYFGNALAGRGSVPIERDIADIESRLNTLRAEGQQIKENKELALAFAG